VRIATSVQPISCAAPSTSLTTSAATSWSCTTSRQTAARSTRSASQKWQCDQCHPDDLGYDRMAEVVKLVLVGSSKTWISLVGSSRTVKESGK
jgi:hypothetical protein